MKGSVFKRCQCTKAELGVDPNTGKPKTCRKRHGSWALMLDVGIDPVTKKRKQLQRSGFATAKEAEETLAELATNVTAGTWTDDKGTTVASWLDTWLKRKEANGLRPATVKIYRQHIDDYLVPSLGALRLRDLRPGHVASLLEKLQAEKGKSGRALSTSTVTRVHACLRSALSTAVKMRLVTFNAARDVELPKVSRARVKPWQPAELGAFLDSVQGDRLASLFEVVAASGMRRGDICGLRWSDIDLKRGVITVRQQLTERAGDNSVCGQCQENHKGLRFATPKTESGEYRKI
jgi:integrase